MHYVIKRQYMGVQASQHRVRDLRIRLQSKQPECFRRAPGEEMPVVLLVARIMFYSAMEYATSLIVGNCINLITLPTK